MIGTIYEGIVLQSQLKFRGYNYASVQGRFIKILATKFNLFLGTFFPLAKLSLKALIILLTLSSLEAGKLEEYQKQADQGKISAQMKLASYHYKKKEFSEAIKYLKLAARKGNPKAFSIIASMFEEGKGVPRNLEKAKKYCKLAIQNGSRKARVNLSRLLENQSNDSEVKNPKKVSFNKTKSEHLPTKGKEDLSKTNEPKEQTEEFNERSAQAYELYKLGQTDAAEKVYTQLAKEGDTVSEFLLKVIKMQTTPADYKSDLEFPDFKIAEYFFFENDFPLITGKEAKEQAVKWQSTFLRRLLMKVVEKPHFAWLCISTMKGILRGFKKRFYEDMNWGMPIVPLPWAT